MRLWDTLTGEGVARLALVAELDEDAELVELETSGPVTRITRRTDGLPLLIIRQRSEERARIDRTIAALGEIVGTALGAGAVCAPCFAIAVPSPQTLRPGSVGALLRPRQGACAECLLGLLKQLQVAQPHWHLAQPVWFPIGPSPDSLRGSTATLQRKLRKAAATHASVDVATLLSLAAPCQRRIERGEWSDGGGAAVAAADALDPLETRLLLVDRLSGPSFEAACLLAAMCGVPDLSLNKVAVGESRGGGGDGGGGDGGATAGSWRLVLVDPSPPPAGAGASLEALTLVTDEASAAGRAAAKGGAAPKAVASPFAPSRVDSGPGRRRYCFPGLLLLPAAAAPLSAAAVDALRRLDASSLSAAVDAAASVSASAADTAGHGGADGLHRAGAAAALAAAAGLHGSMCGEVVGPARARLEQMRRAVLARPQLSLREVCFEAVAAWRRDWGDASQGGAAATLAELTAWSARGLVAAGGLDEPTALATLRRLHACHAGQEANAMEACGLAAVEAVGAAVAVAATGSDAVRGLWRDWQRRAAAAAIVPSLAAQKAAVAAREAAAGARSAAVKTPAAASAARQAAVAARRQAATAAPAGAAAVTLPASAEPLSILPLGAVPTLELNQTGAASLQRAKTPRTARLLREVEQG